MLDKNLESRDIFFLRSQGSNCLHTWGPVGNIHGISSARAVLGHAFSKHLIAVTSSQELRIWGLHATLIFRHFLRKTTAIDNDGNKKLECSKARFERCDVQQKKRSLCVCPIYMFGNQTKKKTIFSLHNNSWGLSWQENSDIFSFASWLNRHEKDFKARLGFNERLQSPWVVSLLSLLACTGMN